MLGPVSETVPRFLHSTHPPIGFLAFDLGYYSSTMDALRLLEAPAQRLLPRVGCFFDDVFGYAWSDLAGARAAIADWGAAHEARKLAKIHGLRYSLPPSQDPLPWHEQMYLAHVLDHPDSNATEGELAGAVSRTLAGWPGGDEGRRPRRRHRDAWALGRARADALRAPRADGERVAHGHGLRRGPTRTSPGDVLRRSVSPVPFVQEQTGLAATR